MKPEPRRPTWFVAATLLLGTALAAGSARAQATGNDDARANALFKEARVAFDAGNYATACPKYEKVVQIKPGLGARLALGNCYRARGDVVQALEMYEAIIADAPTLEAKATTPKEKDNVKKRSAEAQQQITEVEPTVGRLTIDVSAAQIALQGFVLQLDGAPVPPERIGKPRWIAPGTHRIEALATGFVTERREVEVKAKTTHTLQIQLTAEETTKPEAKPSTPADKPAPPLPETKAPALTAPSALPPPASPQQTVDTAAPGRTPMWAWVAGSLGAGALVAGAIFAVKYVDTVDAAAADCPDRTCKSPGLADEYEAQWNRNAAMMGVFGGIGAVGIGVFVAGVISARGDAPRAAPALGFTPWAGQRQSGILVHGTF
ncbi:tetratricopeptide repeat protein [Polyangium jinanense]|uniref:tetratricopeptide repeat protein n=1 Tax=Polyangium jinanense TaxID=2829994 RepID=UPI002340CAE0|nr:tetratricopeptide repeat protein [Polyangium jinanense]MDC3958531.1 tetratricopeptide repeat protein [Polyangium jinanense]